MLRRVQVCLGSERTTEGTGGRDGCKFWKHDDAMHMMTWQDSTCKQMTRQQQRITGRHLAQQSRGVTTLHHYKRISSRDIRMAPERNRRGREEVKRCCLFDKWVKPKNLERLKSWKKWHNRVEHNWEHCGRTNRNKEHHVNLGGCKAMDDEYNGQERIETTLVETR